MNPLVTERLKNCQPLPSLPGVAFQILELCEGDHPDLQAMTDVISRDPALAVHVVKVISGSRKFRIASLWAKGRRRSCSRDA